MYFAISLITCTIAMHIGCFLPSVQLVSSTSGRAFNFRKPIAVTTKNTIASFLSAYLSRAWKVCGIPYLVAIFDDHAVNDNTSNAMHISKSVRFPLDIEILINRFSLNQIQSLHYSLARINKITHVNINLIEIDDLNTCSK